MAQTLTPGENNEDVRSVLEAHIQSGHLNFFIGSGASMPAISVAGNVEDEINQLLEDGKAEEANLRALAFIEDLEDVNTDVLAGIESDEINQTHSNYVEFLMIVDRLLFERKNLLLPRQATLFTTNYDVFFETAASQLPSILLNDGFDRSSVRHRHFRFAPEKYFDRTYRSGNAYGRQAEVPTFNLIKVHGSLTWSRSHHDEILFSASEQSALSEQDRSVPEKVKNALLQRAIILPNIRKFETTVLERVYFDLLRLYSNSMDKENALLIAFGFSFADEHILDITRRALRNPTAKLIIFAYSTGAAETFESLFKEQRNVQIIAPTGEEHITFTVMNEILSTIAPHHD